MAGQMVPGEDGTWRALASDAHVSGDVIGETFDVPAQDGNRLSEVQHNFLYALACGCIALVWKQRSPSWVIVVLIFSLIVGRGCGVLPLSRRIASNDREDDDGGVDFVEGEEEVPPFSTEGVVSFSGGLFSCSEGGAGEEGADVSSRSFDVGGAAIQKHGAVAEIAENESLSQNDFFYFHRVDRSSATNEDFAGAQGGTHNAGGGVDTDIASATEVSSDDKAATGGNQMSKARVDLLLRCMAAADVGQHHDQGACRSGTTPQRQRLQRKLFLRSQEAEASQFAVTAALVANAVNGTAAAPTAVARACQGSSDSAVAATSQEDVRLQDLSQESMEKLLRELEEPEAAQPASAPKAAGGRKAAPPRAARKRTSAASAKVSSPANKAAPSPRGVASAAQAEAQTSEQAIGEPHSQAQRPSQQPQPQYEEDMPPTGGSGVDTCSAPECPPEGFQVVEHKKARKKNRRSAPEFGLQDAAESAGADEAAVDADADIASDSCAAADVQVAAVSLNACRQADVGCLDSALADSSAASVGMPLATELVVPTDASSLASGRLGQEDADEEWEWQCPSGYRLEPYKCPEPVACASCSNMQPAGSTVLRSKESGWVACEECIGIAWEQPART